MNEKPAKMPIKFSETTATNNLTKSDNNKEKLEQPTNIHLMRTKANVVSFHISLNQNTVNGHGQLHFSNSI